LPSYGPVGRPQLWTGQLPPQDHDLVAEDQQFDLVGRSTPTKYDD
jgi:hypothetical protein